MMTIFILVYYDPNNVLFKTNIWLLFIILSHCVFITYISNHQVWHPNYVVGFSNYLYIANNIINSNQYANDIFLLYIIP